MDLNKKILKRVLAGTLATASILPITKAEEDVNVPNSENIVIEETEKNGKTESKSWFEANKKNLGIEHGCSNNNILILTPSSFKESNQDKYKELCELVENFDLKTINLLFKELSKNIHSGYGTK